MEKQLKFEHQGITFHIRGQATRGDQYEMHAQMADHSRVGPDGNIVVSGARLHPWLIERFVTGWSVSDKFTLKALMDQPAEPGDDVVLLLGSFILNHTGLAPSEDKAALKNA